MVGLSLVRLVLHPRADGHRADSREPAPARVGMALGQPGAPCPCRRHDRNGLMMRQVRCHWMNQSSRGIASFMAVASLTMLGMAVLALSVLLDLNVSWTRRQVASAQLMQLLQTPVTGGYLDDARLDA